MLKADMLPKVHIPTRHAMENKVLLRSRISLVRLRTGLKNKIHAIIDRNRDVYIGLENLSDIFGKTGTFMLSSIKIPNPDYMILTNYLDLIADINKKIVGIEKEIDKRITPDKDIVLLKTIPGMGTITAFILKSTDR
jgi:transposase